MDDFDKETWFDLYSFALVELERALMVGRISDARIAIAARLEELRNLSGPHDRERDVIDGALRNLRVLETEEARLVEGDQKRILNDTLQKLQAVAPSPNQ
jgi:hypothetical protein